MTHEEKALSLFDERSNCSQSVLASFTDDIELTEEQAFKIACCFSAGMRKGEVCGACSGALMVIGMMFGQTDKNDTANRERSNRIAAAFLERFRKANGSYICREILNCDISVPEEAASARSKGLFRVTCRSMVASAVRILEEIISDETHEGTAS